MRAAFFSDAKYVGAFEWMQYLAKQEDFDVHAIVFPGHEREIGGVTVHTLPGWHPASKLRYLSCVPALKRTLRRLHPDLLIGYRIVSYGFSAAMSGFHPLVLAAQGMYIASRAHTSLTRGFARRALRSADLLHSWAPIMTANMVALGADPARILTLTRGVDDTALVPGDEPPAPLTLVTTRQLEPYYNYPTLLRALLDVRRELGEVRYLVAGEGSLRGELEALVARMGLGDTVSFLGRVEKSDLLALLRRAHLYVAAVPSDGTSSSMLEAMAAGVLPIVADNESNRHWLRDGEGGWLVPAFDAGAYAQAILRAWADPAWRARAREVNRGVVESRASWSRNMASFVQAYRNLVLGAPPPSPGPCLDNPRKPL